MENENCLYCGAELDGVHGNQQYCLDTYCYELAKAERQSSIYEVGNDSKKAIQKNYKLFVDLLLDDESREVELTTVQKRGFNPDGYFGILTDKDHKNKFFRVHDIYFSINYDNNPKIFICKISKT